MFKISPVFILLLCQSAIMAQSPVITQPPVDQRATEGQSAQFSVVATGSNLLYQWLLDGVPLVEGGRISGAATATLSISNAQQSDAGSYSVVVSESGSPDLKTSSDGALLKVDPLTPPEPQITQPPVEQTVTEGALAQFAVVATGSNLVYEWAKDGVPLVDGGRISGANTATLSITGALSGDEGSYSVVVTVSGFPELKASSDGALLKVKIATPSAPLITQPPAGQIVTAGQNAQFTVTATGTNLVYQWTRDGEVLLDGGRVSGSTTAVLTVTGAQDLDQGSYSVLVSVSGFPHLMTNSDGVLLQVNPATGSLRVTINPPDAVAAGAQWAVDGNAAWQSSNATLPGVATGNHTVSFKAVSGWTTPGDQTVSVSVNQIANASANYVIVPTRILVFGGSLAFRNVPVGSSVQRTLVITNAGNTPLNVSSISYPTGFSGNWTGGTISANGTQTVAVRFSPTQAVAYADTITVTSDATSGNSTIAVSGTGIDASALVPSFFEEFDTPQLNTSNWPYRGQWYGGDLRVENNRLAFTAIGKVPKNHSSEAYILSKPVGSYDSDFVFTADLVLDRDMSRTDSLSWAVDVASSRSYSDIVRFSFNREFATGTQQIRAALINDYNNVAGDSLIIPAESNVDKVRIKVVYNSALRTMECLYAVLQDGDLVGDWTSVQTFGIDGDDGENGNTDWQMQTGDQFNILMRAWRSSASNDSLENLFYGAYASRVWFADMGAALSVLSNAGPNGRVSPSGERMSREGGGIRYIAIPDPGYEVSSWLVNGANAQSGGLTFPVDNIQTDTDVEVQFRKMSSVPIIAGVYDGVVGDGQIGSGAPGDMEAFLHGNGFVTLSVRSDRTFTGSLRFEGKILAFKGQFNSSGVVTAYAKRRGKSDIVVLLTFDPAGKITGTVSIDGMVLDFAALPSTLYSGAKTNIHPLTDNHYTTILPSPDGTLGHGYATLEFAAKGTMRIVGKLADGTPFTAASRTVDDGVGNWMVPVQVPLYAKRDGMLVGQISILKSYPKDSPDLSGTLSWLRAANTKAKTFEAGFLKKLLPIGERHRLQNGISLLTGTEASEAFTLTMDPPSWVLTDPQVFSGTWPRSNAPSFTTKSAKMTMTLRTGAYKGTFLRTVGTKKISTLYEGVILANPLTLPGGASPVQGGGFFSTGTESGPIELTVP